MTDPVPAESLRVEGVNYSDESWNISGYEPTKDFEEAQEFVRDLETKESTPEEES